MTAAKNHNKNNDKTAPMSFHSKMLLESTENVFEKYTVEEVLGQGSMVRLMTCICPEE